MKDKIHPKYTSTAIRCACGNVIETRSTKENITIQICSSCHPFFTGEQKLIDSSGRIDKFKKRFGGAVNVVSKKKVREKKSEKKEKEVPKTEPKTDAKNDK